MLEEIKQNVKVFNDGINTIIPVPNDAPRDIPRILLRSKDSSIGCNISFNKINIFWLNTKEKTIFKIPIIDIQNLTEKLSSIILPLTPIKKVKRVGYINEFFYESENPVRLIEGKTIYKRVTKKLKDFAFRFTYKLELKIHLNCNKVITINSRGKKQTEEKKVIMLMDDINTSQRDDVNWGIQEIKNFIKEADKKIDKSVLMKSFFNLDES